MIERKFIGQNIKELQIEEYITQNLDKVGHSHTNMVKTPLGEKVKIFVSKPGLVVGRKGQNIKQLTRVLKKRFNLENPQIEINEVENPNLDARIVAEKIAYALERFGSQRFKAIAHKAMGDSLKSGAIGIEIVISGKVPSARAKSWRFYSGYLKKCGDVSLQVKHAAIQSKLKTGIVGIRVSITPPDIVLPDQVKLLDKKEDKIEPEETKKEIEEKKLPESLEEPPKEKTIKKVRRKKKDESKRTETDK